MAAIIQYRLTGGATNTVANNSLGGVSSSTQVSTTTQNNLFDNVSETEAASGDVEYRAVDIFNSGDASATSVSVYISQDTPNANTEVDIGIDSTPLGSTVSVANESTAPTGVTFSHYNTSSRLSLPDVPANNYVRLWIRRTVTAGATNAGSDSFQIKVVAA